MSIPRRPVAKPAAAAAPEPPSPSGSISSLLSAYSRSSSESAVRSSDGDGYGYGTAANTNSSSEATFSPTQESMFGSSNAFPLPPRGASLAASRQASGEPQITENNAAPPMPPAKNEGRPPDSPMGGSNWAPAQAAADEPGMRSRSSSQATTSDLWARRTAKSNQAFEPPELKLATNYVRTSEDSQVLPNFPRTVAPAAQSAAGNYSPARPSPLPASAKTQSPLPPAPAPAPAPAEPEPSQKSGDGMGQKTSRLKSKLNALRGGVGKHLKGSPSQSEAVSPPTQQLAPNPQGAAESASVSPLSSEMSREEYQSPRDVQQPPPQQQQPSPPPPQQQQQQQQQAPPERKPLGSSTLHSARSLPEMKTQPPQTMNERPPPVPAEYSYPQPSASQQSPPPAEHKFPPRTSSTRGPAPFAQRPAPQQFPERGRPRAGSNAVHDYRAPSVDPHLNRTASHTSLADYYSAPPPPRQKPDDTVYREVKQEDLPPPDPRAMYFPQQTSESNPAPAAGTVFKAPELTGAHHGCFQRHGKMIMARNKHYPLTCMTCEVEDAELRWLCAWCRVRVCGSCMRLLQSYDRDLGKVLNHVASQPDRTSGGGSEGSRPGSDGLQAVVESPEERASMVMGGAH